jgi:hypothetical protein
MKALKARQFFEDVRKLHSPDASVPGVPPPAPGSASSKRRFVTVVYEIKDDAAWRDGGNPLHCEHHGLKSVCVSAGDLASLGEEIEAIVYDGQKLDGAKYNELYEKNVMASFPVFAEQCFSAR